MSTPPTQREYWNGKVGDEWVDQAGHMDAVLRPMTDAAFATLRLQAGESVLDIGCGAGATTLIAARQVGEAGRVVGVDLSRPLLDLARQRAKTAGLAADFLEADAGRVAIPGALFDAAFSRFGVMFFDDPSAAFRKLREALRPSGRLVFVCWRTPAENVWSHAALGAITPLLSTPPTPPDPNAPGPFALSDRGKIEHILGAAGWRDVDIARWDGDVRIGGDAREAARFLLKIGPCARAVGEQGLDRALAEKTLTDFFAGHETPAGVYLPAACWIVHAKS